MRLLGKGQGQPKVNMCVCCLSGTGVNTRVEKKNMNTNYRWSFQLDLQRYGTRGLSSLWCSRNTIMEWFPHWGQTCFCFGFALYLCVMFSLDIEIVFHIKQAQRWGEIERFRHKRYSAYYRFFVDTFSKRMHIIGLLIDKNRWKK